MKSVTKWLGNSKVVAMKHYVMALESDFQKAAGIESVTRVTGSVTASSGVDRKPQETLGAELADSQRFRGDLAMKSRIGEEKSYPARVAPTAENAGYSEQYQISTPKSTPPVVLLADCIRQHLPPAALEQLLAAVAGSCPARIKSQGTSGDLYP